MRFHGTLQQRDRQIFAAFCTSALLASAGCRPDELQDPDASPGGGKHPVAMAVAPTNGLIGEWKLDETGGTTAVDSKNGYNATVFGGAAFVPGRLGNALDLNNGTAGTGGKYAQLPSNPELDTVQEGNYTISAWFYAYSAPTDATVDNRNWAIVVKYGQHMGLVYEVGQTFSARHYLTGNIFLAAHSASTYPLNTWHHVAGVVSKTAGTIKIYVNGILTGTQTFAPNTLSRDYGTNPFRIGRAQSYWAADGKVDQVRIYNRDLSDAEIADLYNENVDVTAPTISAIASAPAWDRAAVMWTTDEGSNSSVDYGLSTGYGSTTPVQGSLVTSHTVLVTGLAPQQIYHYRVRSRDAAGNTRVSSDRTFSTSPSGTLAAFPGAQGSGATGTGGRGGVVIQVTNLNDVGGGSLRGCMTASGPRTCVFQVAGTINLTSQIRVSSPGLTVAGQTAPGGGILLKGKNNLENQVSINAPDVVLRYLRIRTGWNAQRATGGVPLDISDGAVRLTADHLSLSWNTDDNSQAWDHSTAGEPKDLSLSYLLIAEGLEDHQSTGFITGSSNNDAGARLMTNIDLHHSMFSNHNHRTPELKNRSARVVNNIFYNNSWASTQLKGGIDVDLVGNVYKKGTYQPAIAHEMIARTSGSQGTAVSGSPSIYLQGNKGWSQPSPGGDQWLLAAEASGDNGPEIGTIPSAWRRGSALATAGVPIITDLADNLESILTGSRGVGASARLDCNGNWVANRDAVDTRLMNQYAVGQGTYPGGPSYEVPDPPFGWPTIASGTPCPDADRDGMPDAWETANGLNPNDPADHNSAAANGSGYTNLEMYLAGMRAR